MAREYTTEELHAKLFSSDDRFHLVDVLPHDSYVNRHIPGHRDTARGSRGQS